MKNKLISLLVVFGLLILYSYKLLDVPTGLTVDEASFGYNAALLSQTGRDERGLPHPIFVLSQVGKDWRQPITQYYLAALFKIFGPSVFLLCFSSVIIAVTCVVFVFLLTQSILGFGAAFSAAMILALAPIVTIQAHMGLDNIMPMPFVLFWLFSLFQYQKRHSLLWVILCALSLGFSFYSYKGMRAVAPVWMILTAVWIIKDIRQRKTKKKDLTIFLLALAPFFLVIPHLEKNYAGAILGNAIPGFSNLYDFFLPYLSSFDPSYLFIRGDSTDLHSTGIHGMLLLSSLPLIFVGIYAALRSRNNFAKFVLLALVTGPLLYGAVGSDHRFSRLLALAPLFAFLGGLGFSWLWEQRSAWSKLISAAIIVLMIVNYADFVKYYWYRYPSFIRPLLGDLSYYQNVARLKEEVDRTKFEPTIHKGVAAGGGESLKFFQVIYFGKLIRVVPDDSASGKDTLLLTMRKEVPCMQEVGESKTNYFILETAKECFKK